MKMVHGSGKLLIAFVLVISTIGRVSANAGPRDSVAYSLLLGIWEGRDQTGAKGLIRFKADTTVEILTTDISFRDTVVNRTIIKLFFEVNTQASPLWLDLVMKAQLNNTTAWMEIKRMKGIVRFITPDQIEIRLTPQGEHRYTSFDTELFDEEESMVLTRRKEKSLYSSL